MNLFQLFAHGEDFHDAATSELEHLLTSAPVALPLYLILNIAVFYGVKKYKKEMIMPSLFAVNLLIGVLSFELVPVVSIIAITVGITMALFVTLTLLSNH